jgi:predicted membrane-bound spermidine synthase
MKLSRVLLAALTLGLVCGPSALDSAAASVPPIRGSDLTFVVFGSAVAGLLVPGLQVLRANPKHGLLALRFFVLMAVFLAATGLSALVTAIIHSDVQPHAFVFFALSIGLSTGVGACHLLYLWRFGNAL